jgi:hypothetical protein
MRYYKQEGCTNQGTVALYHDTGVVWGAWPAHSGRDNGSGSIVDGRYRVDPDMIRHRRPWSRNWPEESWGLERLTLEPTPRTQHGIEEAGRTGGFFLHGGTHDTTLGCVRLGNEDLEELFNILEEIGTPIELKIMHEGLTEDAYGEQIPYVY